MTSVQTQGPLPANPAPNPGPQPSYFWHVALLYIAFNVLLSPLQSWADLIIGLRTANAALLNHPFAEGNFFFYPIVLNSDSIFRVVQHMLMPRGPGSTTSLGLFLAIAACVILLAFSLVDYSGWQGIIARGAQPALPAADQIFFTALSLITGYYIHHSLTRQDFLVRR